jgi:hypothetical protein
VSKSHPFSLPVRGRRVSPYLQSLMTYAGVNEVYAQGKDLFAKFLRIEVSTSQVYRVTVAAGEDLSEDDLYTGLEDVQAEVVYAQADGSMILTEEGWREVKVGRVFGSDAVVKQGSETALDRTQLASSVYCAYLGDHQGFKPQMEGLLSQTEPEKLVFLSDGALWLAHWISEKYPEATQILDFYHALEHLAEATRGALKPSDWLEQQKDYLLNSQLDIVLENVDKLKKVDAEKKAQLKQYYENNRYRMDYARYLARGWYIGSGAIESAHRTLIQERMKLSGQRWGNNAQALIKLRVAFASGKQDLVNQLFKNTA